MYSYSGIGSIERTLMVYSVTPEAEARRPEGTTGTDYKKSDGFYFILF